MATGHALAWDGNKCDQWRNIKHNRRPFPFSISTSTAKWGTSTSQFTTSSGACALFGLREQRAVFIAENSEQLSLETAQGLGEYLDALAQLSGCETVQSQTQFKTVMQKNYATLYLNGTDMASAPKIAAGIDRLIQGTPGLSHICQIPES